MRIAIDIDSTLHHYWDQFDAAAQRLFGVALPYERQFTWEIAELEPEQVLACVRDTHRDDNVLAAVPYPGAVEAVRAWHDAGHFIHVTSHRSSAAHDATEQWLRGIGLPFDELYCSYDKIARCVEIGIDLLIDDSPTNLRRAVEAGMHAATLRHPWNRDLAGVIVADDWPALARALHDLLQT